MQNNFSVGCWAVSECWKS